jgi:hypothetical protein
MVAHGPLAVRLQTIRSPKEVIRMVIIAQEAVESKRCKNNYSTKSRGEQEMQARRLERARHIARRVYEFEQDERVWCILLTLYLNGPMNLYQLYKKMRKKQLHGFEPVEIRWSTFEAICGLNKRCKNRLAYLVRVWKEGRGKRKKTMMQLTELGEAIVKKKLYEGQAFDYQSLVNLIMGMMERLPFPPRERLRRKPRKNTEQHMLLSCSGDRSNNPVPLEGRREVKQHINTKVHPKGAKGVSKKRNTAGGRRTEIRALWRVLKEATNEGEITRRDFGGCISIYFKLKNEGWTIGQIWKAIKYAGKKLYYILGNALSLMRWVYRHMADILREIRMHIEAAVISWLMKKEEEEKEATREQRLKKIRELKERLTRLSAEDNKPKGECELCGAQCEALKHYELGSYLASMVEVIRELKRYAGMKLCSKCYTNLKKREYMEWLKKHYGFSPQHQSADNALP